MKYISKLVIIFVFSILMACHTDKHNLYEHHDESSSFLTIGGEKVDIQKFKGKYLIVNYWATWCSPCIKELPELVQFNKEYSQKAVVIGVNLEDIDKKELDNFVKKFNINYPNFKADIVYQLLGLELVGYPTTYIFNSKGSLIKTIQGPVSSQILKQVIQ